MASAVAVSYTHLDVYKRQDMEWGMRIRNHGYRVVATSLSEVVHPGFSERTLSPLFVYYAWRNHLYFIAVTYSGIRRIFYLCYISGLLHAAKINAQYVNKNFPFVKAYNLAFRDFCEAKFGKMDRSIEAFSCAGSGDLFKDKDIEALFGTNNVVLLSADRSVAVVKLTIDVLKGRFPNTCLLYTSLSQDQQIIEQNECYFTFLVYRDNRFDIAVGKSKGLFRLSGGWEFN